MIWEQDGITYTLILNAGHAEYSIRGAKVVWDPYHKIAEIDIEEVIAAPHNPYLWYDEDLKEWGTLIRLKGGQSYLHTTFHNYLNSMDESFPPSGDDDVYDYWPSGMRMLWEFAIDMASITNQEDSSYINSYYELLDHALEHEWERGDAPMIATMADEWSHVPLSKERAIEFLVKKLRERAPIE